MLRLIVAQRKGGVGKTTIAAHLAGYWASQGAKVLMIDTDPQGDLSRVVGLRPRNGLFHFLVPGDDGEYKPLDQVLVSVPWTAYAVAEPPGTLALLPSADNTAGIASFTNNPFILNKRLALLDNLFDIAVIDSAPTLSAFDAYTYLAADVFVFVTQCEPLSAEGLREGIAYAEEFGARRVEYELGGLSRVVGIIPNQVSANLTIHRTFLENLVNEYGRDLVFHPIPTRAKYKESTDFGQLIYAYAANGGEAADMTRMAKEVEAALHVIS
jgi:chromosome partitioning protein